VVCVIDRRDIIDLTLVRSNFFSSLDEYKYAGPQIQQGTLSPNIGVSHINLIGSGGSRDDWTLVGGIRLSCRLFNNQSLMNVTFAKKSVKKRGPSQKGLISYALSLDLSYDNIKTNIILVLDNTKNISSPY
jgi:hypothetical protein